MFIVLVNVRSGWNVGSVMRTCDALGAKLILVGYTPKPVGSSLKLIQKTAIGAEKTVAWQHFSHWNEVLTELATDYLHIAIEISSTSQDLFWFLQIWRELVVKTTSKPELDLQSHSSFQHLNQEKWEILKTVNLDKICLWFGNEIHGLEAVLCRQLDFELHLPMKGTKESLNVANTVCAVGYLCSWFKVFNQNYPSQIESNQIKSNQIELN